ncbi:MAG: hypothetical protein F8N36_12085 [Desulfovibrio sp.]|uniref:hypothetical protein n=1 Tax=Desulfovibrio sp. TaxID=885 RepID=UPI00135D1E61|nr:hypothetical protein [Desulfovibrio sp.]MTJ93587.1 hypothetical protein [Desulfovibrio sp.]
MANIVSSHIHPMRYMRNRPFARKAMQLYRRMVGRGIPTMEALQAITGLMMPAYNDGIMSLPFEKRPERPTAMITQEMSLAMHVGAFVEHGRNIFFLEPHIVELLDRTDLTGVRCCDIRLPFDSFHISFGDAFDGCLPGPPNKIDGAYITTHPQHGGSFQVVVTSRRLDVRNPDKPNRWPLSRDLYFYAPLDISDPEATIEDAVRKAVVSGEIKIQQTALAPDDDAVVETQSGPVLVRDVRHLTDADETAWTREALPTFRRALALVVNALCYLNATEEDGEERELPDDAPPDLKAQWKSPKVNLRDRAKAGLLERGFIPVVVRKSAPGQHGNEPGAGGEGRPVEAHWRRGHWRRQPYGQGRALIKLKWIRPTLVASDGSDIPDTPGHLYRLT